MKNKFALAIHGGASHESKYLKTHLKECEQGLKEALLVGYQILKKNGSALNAVEQAVKALEDNELFNAGRGSVLNREGEVEMDAAIMDGKKLMAGAVSMVRNVKNPIVLARAVMNKTDHVFLSGYGALEFAKSQHIYLEPESYFITEHQYQEFLKYIKKPRKKDLTGGTVGAVALDKKGNLAAATSTGGLCGSLPGRIGDSCLIGAGCYANNKTCAVSGTGVGEVLINNVIAHTISMLYEFKKQDIQKICNHVILKRHKPHDGPIGVIAIDRNGKIGISYSSQIMKRAWITTQGEIVIKIYK